MMTNVMRTVAVLSCACVLVGGLAGAAQAPPAAQAGFKRTPVQQGDLSIPGREAVQAVAEFAAGAESGRHTHPGEELAYILEGTITVEIEGKPAVVKKAGEGIMIPAGTVHNARNTGQGVAKVLATYVIEKGKPVATPVK
jgi:quercetin dioxygenase-like cupin family protein